MFYNPSFQKSLVARYVILFAIALFTTVISPWISTALTTSTWALSNQVPLEQTMEAPAPIADFARSLTHQEPNFYQ